MALNQFMVLVAVGLTANFRPEFGRRGFESAVPAILPRGSRCCASCRRDFPVRDRAMVAFAAPGIREQFMISRRGESSGVSSGSSAKRLRSFTKSGDAARCVSAGELPRAGTGAVPGPPIAMRPRRSRRPVRCSPQDHRARHLAGRSVLAELTNLKTKPIFRISTSRHRGLDLGRPSDASLLVWSDPGCAQRRFALPTGHIEMDSPASISRSTLSSARFSRHRGGPSSPPRSSISSWRSTAKPYGPRHSLAAPRGRAPRGLDGRPLLRPGGLRWRSCSCGAAFAPRGLLRSAPPRGPPGPPAPAPRPPFALHQAC